MDIVCFGQQNWDVTWTEKQHLTSRLAARGHRVLFVDPTWVGMGQHSAAEGGLRHEGPGELHVLTYRYRPLLRWRGNLLWWPRTLRRNVRRLGFRDPVAVAFRPPALPLMRAIPTRGKVYFVVDEVTAFGERSDQQRRDIRLQEEEMLRSVDVAVGISRRLRDRFATLHPDARYLPNASDLANFAPETLAAATPHPALADLPDWPTLVFVGQIDERMNQPLILRLARELNTNVVLAGRVKHGVDVSLLESEPLIRFLGFVEYEDLPRVLRVADVCLVPYHVTELTRSCNPAKVYEYLATGRPVVATALDGLEWCEDVIDIAADGDAFIAATRRRMRDPTTGRGTRLARAEANTWEARTEEFYAILKDARRHHDRREAQVRARPDHRFRSTSVGAKSYTMYGVSQGIGRILAAGRFLRRSFGNANENPARILVSRRTRLGDLVVLLPMLDALRARFSGAQIDLAVQPDAVRLVRALLKGRGVVDRVIGLDFLSADRLGERLRGALRLTRQGYDVHVSGAGYSMMREALFSGAPLRVGLDERHPLQRLTNRRVLHRPDRHEAENQLALAEALGAVVVGPARVPRLQRPDPSQMANVLRCLGLTASADYLVFHPGAQKPSRRWDEARYAELAGRLLTDRPRLEIVLTGTVEEVPLHQAIVEGLGPGERRRCRSVAGETDLRGLVAVLAGAALVVCGDTGILHLARALGVPLVALLGPENEMRWGPHPGGRGPALSVRHDVPCSPCKRWSCGPHYCLEALSVEEAGRAVAHVLEVPGPVVSYPGWAAGHGKAPPRVPSEIGDRHLHPARALRRIHDWRTLEGLVKAPEIPLVFVASASGTDSSTLLGQFAYPRRRLRPVEFIGEDPFREVVLEGEGSSPLLALVEEAAAWRGDRLGSGVATLVRRPDLAFVECGETGSSRGLLVRVSVAREILRGEEKSSHVGPAEFDRARAALRTYHS